MMRKIATGAAIAGVLGLGGLAIPAQAATAPTVTEHSARWPCQLQAKKAVRVHKRANKTSPYWTARKGTRFYGYCWSSSRPIGNWAEVRRTLNGSTGYVWWADLKVIR
ncbi:MAG: hypothetical protein HOY71_46625 [Nonomuraea sp.]|nr:hypothetical protein [Nonomuraea sp.]